MKTQSNTCIDFGRSFINGNGSVALGKEVFGHNDPRFWIESAVRLFDDRAGTSAVYYQCGSCKSENTFTAKGPGDLFSQPNYDFMPVFGPDEVLIFRRGDVLGDRPYRSVVQLPHPWGIPDIHLVTSAKTRRLGTFEEFVAASRACLPIVGKTAIADAETGLRAEVEYPIKTINIHYNPDVLQIDTGPVMYPDLSQRYESWAHALSLAFVAYETRTSDFADFILEAPVPLEIDGKEVCLVMHYSKAVACKADNSLWSITP